MEEKPEFGTFKGLGMEELGQHGWEPGMASKLCKLLLLTSSGAQPHCCELLVLLTQQLRAAAAVWSRRKLWFWHFLALSRRAHSICGTATSFGSPQNKALQLLCSPQKVLLVSQQRLCSSSRVWFCSP